MDMMDCSSKSLADAINTVVRVTTDTKSVRSEFLFERWDTEIDVVDKTPTALRDGDDVETVARSVAENAVKYEMLHHSLLEHAVLHVCHKLDGASSTDII